MVEADQRAGEAREQQEREYCDAGHRVHIEPAAARRQVPGDRESLQRPPEVQAGGEQEQHGDIGPADDGFAERGLRHPVQAQVELMNLCEQIGVGGALADDRTGIRIHIEHLAAEDDASGEVRRA